MSALRGLLDKQLEFYEEEFKVKPAGLYSREGNVFYHEGGIRPAARLACNLIEGAKIGNVNLRLWTEPILFEGSLERLFSKKNMIIGFFSQAKNQFRLGVETWSPLNDTGTVNDYWDFFINSLRKEGNTSREGDAVNQYRNRVRQWVEGERRLFSTPEGRR